MSFPCLELKECMQIIDEKTYSEIIILNSSKVALGFFFSCIHFPAKAITKGPAALRELSTYVLKKETSEKHIV